MILNVSVQEPYFSYILNGTKTVEGRLNKGKFSNIQVGDTLRINNQVDFLVISKNLYIDFKDMIIGEGITNVIPDARSIDAAVAIYYKFYTPKDEATFGVVGIKIKKIPGTQPQDFP